MGKKIDKVTGETKYYIPVDGKYYETSEEVYQTYFKMGNREYHQKIIQRKYESSYEELKERGFQVENQAALYEDPLEEAAVTKVMIEEMLTKLSLLNDYERWLLQEIYTNGKTFRQIEEETGTKRSTLWEQKEHILLKLRKAMKIKINIF